jgi:hypothetical protein
MYNGNDYLKNDAIKGLSKLKILNTKNTLFINTTQLRTVITLNDII